MCLSLHLLVINFFNWRAQICPSQFGPRLHSQGPEFGYRRVFFASVRSCSVLLSLLSVFRRVITLITSKFESMFIFYTEMKFMPLILFKFASDAQ